MTAVVDTSVLFAAANPRERAHEPCARAVAENSPGIVVPQAVLAETMGLILVRLGLHAQRAFWDAVLKSRIEILGADAALLQEGREIDRTYEDSGFGFVDCLVLATCERERCARLLTLDRKLALYRPTFAASLEVLP